MCDMTHLYVRHDSFKCATWLLYMCDMTPLYVRHDSFKCATWLLYMCDMTHLYVRHDSFICAKWLIYMCDMTHLYVRNDSFICATWLIYMCDMTHLYVRHDSFAPVPCATHLWKGSFICLEILKIENTQITLHEEAEGALMSTSNESSNIVKCCSTQHRDKAFVDGYCSTVQVA